MAGFWIATALMVVMSAGLIALALRRGALDDDATAHDVQVYRDQLAEVDRDLARGVLDPADADRVKTEIARRILGADAGPRPAATEDPGAPASVMAAVLAALVIGGGGYWIYTSLGAPGYGDFGLDTRIAMAEEARAARPSQAELEAAQPPAQTDASPRVIALVEQLREVLQERPDDLRGFELLAQYEGGLGNYKASYEAQQRVIEIKGDSATPTDIGAKAELMILAAGGTVSPEAEALLNEALSLNPTLGSSRYYMGLMHAQTGRQDLTFQLWSQLLERGPEEAPWIPPIRAQIEGLAEIAGVRYTPPPVNRVPGPTQDDLIAAEDMTPAEQMEMIRGMVDRLSTRLATEGGTPSEWAQLISSLSVVGEMSQAEAVWQNAQEVFADAPDALIPIQRAAQMAGLDQ